MNDVLLSAIPEGIIEVPLKPYLIKDVKRGLIVNDLHFPFHNKRAIQTALDYDDSIDFILINGDLLDCHKASSKFRHNPAMPEIKDEINIGKNFIAFLRGKFPKKRIIFYEGNHDERLKFYVWDKAPALFGIEAIQLKSLLELDKHGVEFIENGSGWKIGSLHGKHGNEAGLTGGINVTRTMLLRTFDNCIFGHVHKTQSTPARNLDDKHFMNWSVGCLCGLKPKYRPINDWNLGFALVEIFGKDFQVENKFILPDYRVV